MILLSSSSSHRPLPSILQFGRPTDWRVVMQNKAQSIVPSQQHTFIGRLSCLVVLMLLLLLPFLIQQLNAVLKPY
jgi:hypothetical protein